MSRVVLAACAGLAVTVSTLEADQKLLVINSRANVVEHYDPMTGALIDPVFIDGNLLPVTWRTPKGIAQVDSEIWIADQVVDAIYRFDLDGVYIGMIADPNLGGGLDNIRGLSFVDGVVYQTNAGTNNSAPGNAIVMFDASGNNLGHFPTQGSPFDIVPFGGQFLVSNITQHQLELYSDTGAFQGIFHSGNLRFPQQIAFRDNGNILVGGFSNPSGIYEFDGSGQEVNFIPAAGVRGVQELGNGNIMYTNGEGVHVYDVAGQFSFPVSVGGESSQYIALIGEAEPPCYANCDGSTTEPILTVDDFTCFINEFAQAQTLPVSQQITHYANCDGSSTEPILTVDDFTCFINAFAQGCP